MYLKLWSEIRVGSLENWKFLASFDGIKLNGVGLFWNIKSQESVSNPTSISANVSHQHTFTVIGGQTRQC